MSCEYYSESITTTIEDFEKICRTCLDDENVTTIFDLIIGGVKGTYLLQYGVGLHASPQDKLPKNICQNCLKDLYKIYKFKRQCHENEATLKRLVNENLANDVKGEIIVKEDDSDVEDGADNKAYHVEFDYHYEEKAEADESKSIVHMVKISTDHEEKEAKIEQEVDKHNVQQCLKISVPTEHPDEKGHKRSKITGPPYICATCPNLVEFKVREDLRKHRLKLHALKWDHVCKICQKIFKHSSVLQRHIKTHTDSNRPKRYKISGPPYICTTCPDPPMFETIEGLRKHRRKIHALKRNHICEICHRICTSSSILHRHIRTHYNEKRYQCDGCLKTFSSNFNLQRHKKTHAAVLLDHCRACGKDLQNSDSGNPHTCESDFQCEVCGRTFKQFGHFNAHLDQHSSDNKRVRKGIRQFPVADSTYEHLCHICGRAHKTRDTLTNHLLTHRERKFVCDKCGRVCASKVVLQSHTRIHTGDKPYLCTVCSKSFAQSNALNNHILTHSGHKPYSCSICSKKFTQFTHLKYHMRTHSGERPYVCKYCDKAFAVNGNLTVHVRTHTGEKPYVCSICNKGFFDSSSMKRHKKKHSSETKSCDTTGTTKTTDLLDDSDCQKK